jgi:phosphoglycolate phosphatase
MPPPPALQVDRVRAIVFDLDGTLVDSYAPITASLNRARFAYSLPMLAVDEVRRRVGHGLESLIADLVGPDRVDDGVRIFREHYAESFAAGTLALPGVPATLNRLAGRGYRMAVASNKPARFGRAILETLGLDAHLDEIQGPDVAGHAKPHPAMIRRCLEILESSPEQSLYVGDMVLDVETAARAGLPVVLVAGGSSTDDDLHATGETVLGCLGELPSLLAGDSA